nr:ABC transporter ATP-binding protein [Deltaproteobacteria bacterium]
PNGAGKTTAMRILTGFMPASSGTARVAGYDIQTQSLDVRRRIGYLPETVPLYKEMTVRAFLRFSATIRGMTGRRRETRIKDVIATCRIEDYARTPIARLSKGYRQLVGVAQAILHEPEVLILDEPTGNLDTRTMHEIMELPQRLCTEGMTIVMVTHSHGCACYAQRILHVSDGSLIEENSANHHSHLLGMASRSTSETKYRETLQTIFKNTKLKGERHGRWKKH